MTDVEVDPGRIGLPEADESEPPPRTQDPRDWPFPADRDWLLARLVDLTTVGVEFGITLHLRGSVVTGTVIAGATYLREQAQQIREAAGASLANAPVITAIADLFSGSVPVYERPQGAPEGNRAPPPNYVHLRNVSFLSAEGSALNTGSTLWRCRIQEVDAFAFGEVRNGR